MKNTARKERTALLRRFLRGSGRAFALCIFCGVGLTICDMLIPQIIRYAVDSVIGGGENTQFPALTAFLHGRFWLLGVMLAAVGLLGAFFRYYNHLFNAKAGETLVKTMRDTLYSHIQQLPWSWHQKNATGDIIQRCTSDVEVIITFFQDQFVSVFRIVILIVFSIGCMAVMSIPLSLVALAFVPIIVSYSLVFHNRIRDRFALCDENEGILSTIAQENLTGVRVVRAFGREDFERQRFEKQNNIYTDCWVTLCRTLAYFWASGDMSSGLQVMSIVVLGSIFCVQGKLSPGEFIAFNSYNAMLVWPVRRLGRMISQMSKAGVSMDRLAYILGSEPEKDAPMADTPPMDGDIAFENVSFAYDEGPEVLHNVSFTVPAGSSFGILGGTGSGKSSLMHLLCRLHEPGSGRITVGSRDIAAMQARHVRSQVGIVLQEPFLFSRTIGENIAICGISAEELRCAAVTACIHDDIMDFSAGYDTLVGERGVTLSGGQKQRVAMARTLSRRTPILIFDDSLSAVDTETDERIRKALARDLHGCTRIIISHRITTLMDCDCVLVLDSGSVAELGSPAVLYGQGGIYRRIYDMQMALGEEDTP